jgi:hypothetical protein
MHLFASGAYATCLAIFVNSICDLKVGISSSIVIIALYFVGIILFVMIGYSMLYDETLFSGFVQFII